MGANLADLVREAAATRPNVPAVVSQDRTTTWSELDRLVHAVAGGLTARRMERGDRVAIVLGNSIEFISSYFGILRAGMVAVPMNTSYTATEIENLLRSSGARLVITDSASAKNVRDAAAGISVVEVGTDDWRRLTVGSTPPPTEETDPESLAVLIYTAGTSGDPKGAMLTHRALTANLDQILELKDPAALLPDDSVLIVLPMFHIYALNAALGMVVRQGATAVIAERFDPIGTAELIKRHKVTLVAGAPAMYVAWSALSNIADYLADVRMLQCGAAPLPVSVAQEFATKGLPIWVGYGMTEASPVISTTLTTGRAKLGSVGQPIPGVEIRLVDEEGNEVRDGDPGEIVVKGANLFSGYWPHGEDGPDDDGWFPTGDVAVADADGDLQLVDRRSELILVSGFNVYPREIEQAIGTHPEIDSIAVLGVPHPATGEAVKALVVLTAGSSLTPEAIVEYAGTRLARFKTPTIVDVVDELPRSVTGKIMKGALRAMQIPMVASSDELYAAADRVRAAEQADADQAASQQPTESAGPEASDDNEQSNQE